MGSLFSKPKIPPAPPPPPAPELTAFRSEISGVERIPVTGADGKTTIVERRIVSDEQRKMEEELQRISDAQLQRIEKLTGSFDVSDIEGLDSVLNDFKKTQQTGIAASFDTRTKGEEQALAKAGVGDSSSATELRLLRGRERQMSENAVQTDAELLKNQIRQQEIGNAAGLFNLVSGKTDNNDARALQTLAGAAGIQQGMLGAQQQYNNAIFQSQLQQQQLQAQARSGGFGNLMGLASLGMLAAGPLGFGFLGRAKSSASLLKA